MSIWWVVGLSVVVVLVSILALRLHAFLTLLLAGFLVATLTGDQALRSYAQRRVADDAMSPRAAESFLEATAADRLADAFGETAGKIGIIIALASIIGGCLLESGAASRIVDSMLRVTGAKRAPEALAASSFVLGIPVFFDTVFYLMVPLARSLRRKLGKDYVLFLMAILAGGSIAHSLVPPTPGPLQVAEIIGVEVGTMLLAGLVIGGCTSVLSLGAARLINVLVDVPLRSVDDHREASDAGAATRGTGDVESELSEQLERTPEEEQRPPLSLSLLPIVLPVILIATASVVRTLVDTGRLEASAATDTLLAFGDKNVALALGCVGAFGLVAYTPAGKRGSIVSRSLASGGNIILITAAGGAFGAMLRQAGIAEAVSSLTQHVPGLMLLPVAFLVTTAIRTLQGSATVAMITAAGVLQGFARADGLPYDPVYLAMAIGAGSKPISWMTDSAFWVITRMSGMTEAEGLRVISPMSTAMGVSALLVTMFFASLVPGV
jgi:GntP family gluconate:H+ symporter